MKKRILALALAGTTAFSMFGGLNVFAAVSADDVYDSYKPVSITYIYSSTSGATVAINNDQGLNFDVETVMDFDDVMDTAIADNTIYLYDFYDSYIDNDWSVSDVEDALDDETNPRAALAKIFANDVAKDEWQAVTYEDGYGERRTIRKEIVDAWEDFLDGVSLDKADYDYLDGKKDIYHFEDLLSDIGDLSTSAAYTKAASSELVYLMQQYEYFVGGGLVDATEYDTGYLDMVIEILENRTAEDFKSSNTYTRSYVFELEDLQAKYEKANTTAKYRAVLADAEKLLFNFAGADTADKDELKGALNDLYYGATYNGKTSYPESGTDFYVLYPAYDFTEDGKTTAEYDEFCSAYEFAYKMVNLGRTYSYQSDMDYVVAMLDDAVAALEPTTSPKASALMVVEEALEDFGNKVETDYKSGWAAYENAVEFAQSVLDGNPGERQTRNAAAIVKDAATSLTAKKVPASTMKALRAAITDAENWLKKNDNYTSDKNAAQILAVRKALDKAIKVRDNTDRLISETEGAIAGIEDALNFAGVTLGWSKNADGKWVYGTDEGYLADGWNKLGNTWYYFNADGTAKQSEWIQENGTWYWFTNNCNAARGWAKVNGEWYFFNDGCGMRTGWVKSAGSWYYLAPSGKMMTGWVEVNGKWYYLSKQPNAVGQMLANTTVDGYKLGADGAWIK